ncbi:MAG: hypothetical protein OES24_01020 [Acidimicrobiia bacterium]|nr:hypothetical protein [Acidimicrobiia bacterium]
MSREAGIIERVDAWRSNFVNHHTHPEWLGGLSIMLLWAVVAFADSGLVFGAGAVVFGVILHYVAMESGSHTWMWLATGVVLLYVLVAYVVLLSDLGPLALTAGGASALAYNETVRVNYMRRRDSVIDPSVFVGSAMAVAVAAGIGLVGIGATVAIGDGTQRAWLWMPGAALAVSIVAYLLVVVPTIRVPANSDRRWVPGTRIPPPDSTD